MRRAAAVELSAEQRQALERMARARAIPARLVERARIVRLAADGLENKQIARQMKMTPEKAARWRNRFLDGGIAALEKDAPRPGAPHDHRAGGEAGGGYDAASRSRPTPRTGRRAPWRGGGHQRGQRAPHLARPRTEAASGADLQTQPRYPLPGETGGHRRPVSESARARHRAVRR
jgi:hypothetical protein